MLERILVNFPSLEMQVNNEQTNTQKMLQHNQMKQKVMTGGSLQRKLVDVCENNVDIKESIILNCREYDSSKLRSIVSMDDAVLLSDADSQMIVKIKFTEKVDVSQIDFYPTISDDESSPPRTVKLFVNQSNLDFNDVESLTPAIEFELPFPNDENESKPFSQILQGSKFTRLSSIQLFVEDNFGTEYTKLGRIKFHGFLAPQYH